jgi:hypothetical protein
VRKADSLPPSCAVVTKTGDLNFLETSGPVQACNGTDLPFTARRIISPYYYIFYFGVKLGKIFFSGIVTVGVT